MQTYKLNDQQLESAVIQLREANKALASARKSADAAKEIIGARLKALRNVELSALPIGEMVNVDKVLIVEIGKQNRFDSASFQIKNPQLYSEFCKDFPTIKFKALI